MKQFWSWIEKNRGLVVSSILGLVMIGFIFACEPKAEGLDGKEVTVKEFNLQLIAAEAEDRELLQQAQTIIDAVENRKQERGERTELFDQDIQEQRVMIQALWDEAAKLLLASGPYGQSAVALGTILLGGTIFDNGRKNGVIGGQGKALKKIESVRIDSSEGSNA